MVHRAVCSASSRDASRNNTLCAWSCRLHLLCRRLLTVFTCCMGVLPCMPRPGPAIMSPRAAYRCAYFAVQTLSSILQSSYSFFPVVHNKTARTHRCDVLVAKALVGNRISVSEAIMYGGGRGNYGGGSNYGSGHDRSVAMQQLALGCVLCKGWKHRCCVIARQAGQVRKLSEHREELSCAALLSTAPCLHRGCT
jgi:hypothetical protein